MASVSVPVSVGAEPLIQVEKFNYAYGDHQVLFDLDLNMRSTDVTALIGPSGCGKSTLLRAINRINDLVDSARVVSGSIRVDGVDLYAPEVDVISLRRNVGMVFQKYNPFPRSIFENAVYGLRVAGVKNRHDLEVLGDRRQGPPEPDQAVQSDTRGGSKA